jgi:acyl carrier protein
VKVRGVRIELGEIENLLLGQVGVKEAAVVACEDGSGNKYLCAYLVLAAGVGTEELRESLRQELPEYMVPTGYVELATLPRTMNGKVDRRALPTLAQARAEQGSGAELGRTPVEEIVAGIWSEVLRLPQVSSSENFFELGGHSLLATQILSRVREALGVELALRSMFEGPTVRQMAQQVEAELQAGGVQSTTAIAVVDRSGELPLSYSQQRLWFLDQLSSGSTAYHIPLGMRLRGELNVGVLEQSIGEVIRRHEILRTRFPASEGRPRQEIAVATAVRLALVDLSGVSAEQRTAESERLAQAEGQRPFNLGTGPLVRLWLMKQGEQEHDLVCTLHHLVSDAWSLEVLTAEMTALYRSYGLGEPSPLPELPIQYADYAVWQRAGQQGAVLEKKLQYWREQLRGAPATLRLPQNRPRPAVPTFRGARQGVELTAELTAAVRELSRREGTTLFMTMLAGFLVLLHQYTGEEDIVVGSVIANREKAEVEQLIGFLANTLVLRTDLTGNPSFRELLGRVREVCLGAYAHQLPPEQLLEELQGEGGGSRQPLFQVWFQVERARREQLQLAGLEWSRLPLESGDTRFELSLVLEENDQQLSGTLEYDADTFSPKTITEMLKDYSALMERMAAKTDHGISTVSMTSSQEREQLSWGFNVNLEAT